MTDLTTKLLPRIHQHRLPGLDLGPDLVYPYYDGYSILNTPSTVCRLLGVSEFGSGVHAPEILDGLSGLSHGGGANGPFRSVIVILMDALALHRLQAWMKTGGASVWQGLAQEGLLVPLTSITPSTTSAALTSYWTGRPAAAHGILGYEMWLKEYGIVANTILHSPITYKGSGIGSLTYAGFTPESFLTLPRLGTHLAAHGVKSAAFQHYSIAHSGLSRMYFNNVDVHSFGTAADLWINLRAYLESQAGERLYTWVYWSEVDHSSHVHGPDDEHPQAEFENFSLAMQRYFLDRLSPQARQETLLILTADHGQIFTPQDPYYELRNHSSLDRRLHIKPSGENRLFYLFIRPGQTEAVREYMERTWPNQFAWLDPVFAVESGLFGPGTLHERLYDRLGDAVLVTRDHAYLWWANGDNPMLGRHGGLHPEEMLVPLLAVNIG